MLDKLNRAPVKVGAALFLAGALIVSSWLAYQAWVNPLGESLDVPTETPQRATSTATETVVVDQPVETPEGDDEEKVTETSEPTLEPTEEYVCGGPASMTVLISGVASDGYLYGLADAIRVVKIDFQHQEISVLALPRDMWVDIPNIEDHGVEQGKLNQAYFYGTEGMGFYDGPGNGSGLLAHTLQQNFGLHVDHYIAVNHYAFRNIVDAIGGVDVYFPEPVYTKWFGEPKLFIKSGWQHLTGREAEKVVRARIEIGDYGRIKNQTRVLKAVAAKMLTPSGIKNLPEIANRLINYVQTDFSPSDIRKLICLSEAMNIQDNVSYHVIPQDMLTEERIMDEFQGYEVYVFMYDGEEIREYISEVFSLNRK